MSNAATTVAPPAVHHLSWTRISTYRDCPRKFAFKYIEQVPEERLCAALPFGGGIHRAAERLAEARLTVV